MIVHAKTIDSILTRLETSHVHPLKRVTKSTGDPRLELSELRAPKKEITREIKEEEDASSRCYEVFNYSNNSLEMTEIIVEKKNVIYLRIECCECI